MRGLIHSDVGLIHLISSMTALVFGTWVLMIRKGTRFHRFLGYTYTFSMLLLNGTAFMIYDPFGGFGPFHFASIISLITLTMGFIPVLTRRPINRWLDNHLAWMYFSVIGLYAAFFSEIFSRIPETPFFGMVGISSVVVLAVGIFLFLRMRRVWINSLP